MSDPNLLEVDHIHGNGSIVRRTRRDGGLHPTRRGIAVEIRLARYLREIRSNPTAHGLQLLCANCHRWITHARRQPLDPP